jgi:hypothetical protein
MKRRYIKGLARETRYISVSRGKALIYYIIKPLSHFHHHRFIYYGALVTAATILLVILLFLFPLFHQKINGVEAGEVWVQAARVEGQPASTFVINQKDPDITIVWIEKINNKTEENNEKNH